MAAMTKNIPMIALGALIVLMFYTACRLYDQWPPIKLEPARAIERRVPPGYSRDYALTPEQIELLADAKVAEDAHKFRDKIREELSDMAGCSV
jgi:hypothetical protein